MKHNDAKIEQITEAQMLFNTTFTHLWKQGRGSFELKDGEPFCLYRGPNGAMCAVGFLISDDEYRFTMEGKTAYGLAEAHSSLEWMMQHILLLNVLQRAHDKACCAKDFRKAVANQYREVATQLDLSTAVIDELEGASA